MTSLASPRLPESRRARRRRSARRRAGRRTILSLLSAVILVLVAVPALRHTPASGVASSSSAVTVTSTATRTLPTQVVTQHIAMSVSQTQNLQGRQEIEVTWSGAHPTGGIVANQTSIDAQYEEYPFVLLECRGIDSTTAAPDEQLTPETCWTQSWSERYQDSLDDTYPPYRLDQYASTADRAAIAGAPSTLPAKCADFETAPVQHWVPFEAANGTAYEGGNGGCAGEAPESDDVGGAALPSNETFGVTGTDGTGSAQFDVFTTQQNASLGCTQNVPCALVAVPIMGITCDWSSISPAPSQSDQDACEGTGAYQPGSGANFGQNNDGADLTVTGSLWWSASNWRNRITVPLTFAPPPGSCSLTGSSANNVIDISGSEPMIQASSQWDPSFCQTSSNPFTLNQIQTGEPEARNSVASGTAEAAYSSFAQPNGYGKPVVNAPVAVTGFAISFDIDGSNGQPYQNLKLTPLLLAKLLTESYPSEYFMKQDDPALANNPLNITDDPEFQALNPGIASIGPGAGSEAASELMTVSSDSDAMSALTTYINDDPTARAWLNGTPDQKGMVVNPEYKGISLPVDHWPLLSTFVPTAYYQTDINDCLYNDSLPYLPLVAAPPANLEAVSQDLQFNELNSTTQCSQPTAGSPVGEKLTTDGQETPGHRFIIGITPLADTQRYLLQSAELQTTPGTFVAPSDQSLQAATALLKPDTTNEIWNLPYPEFEQSAGASAYPGTMVVYAAIPTTGLPAQDAQEYAVFLRFAATVGQTQGSGVGQLPPGYLPLTTADGLGGLAAYTVAAAVDVAAQNGQVPPVVGTPGGSPGSSSPSSGSQSASAIGSKAFSPQYNSSGSEVGSAFAEGRLRGHASSVGHAKHLLGSLRMVSSLIDPARVLWTAGFPAALLFGLGFLGTLTVPLTFRLGRKRGRW
ncbi:MAG TPA: hypothetical protein VN793_00105 [Acidimicrobiales bacterium]|nr:hypothetical protein [Acidimicrobiales bacterium]